MRTTFAWRALATLGLLSSSIMSACGGGDSTNDTGPSGGSAGSAGADAGQGGSSGKADAGKGGAAGNAAAGTGGTAGAVDGGDAGASGAADGGEPCTGDASCPVGSACCDGQCIDTSADPLHCGGCAPCPAPDSAHADPICTKGVCGFGKCKTGFGDCNGVPGDGCESDLAGQQGCPCVPGTEVDCYEGPAGTEGKGPCAGGKKTCNANGVDYGPCVGQVLPGTENCNDDLDNDCNGLVNDSGNGCVCMPGATQACYSGSQETRGVGQCKDGTQTCDSLGTAWGACAGEVLPSTEDCSQPGDEDCNGQVNESAAGCLCAAGATQSCYGGPSGTENVGQCVGGTQTCKPDGKGWGECAGQVLPGQEGCNDDIDNDCNGLVNDGGDGCVCLPISTSSCYEGPAGTEGVGPCMAGTKTCNALGTAWGACDGQVVPQPETCLTPIDDDCNGAINESGAGCVCAPNSNLPCYTGPAGTLDVGACAAGVQTCSADGTAWGPCQGETTPVAETCLTLVDDDCDGQMNESGAGCVCSPGAVATCYEGPAGTVNVGVCKAGSRTCDDTGTVWGPCTGQVLPGFESCSTTEDDDCNGSNLVCTAAQDCIGGSCVDPCDPVALGKSYIGCEYYPAPTPTAISGTKVGPGLTGFHYAVAISNTGSKAANYVITRGTAFTTSGVVAANSIQIVQLPWVAQLDTNITASLVSTNAGGAGAYRLVTTRPVTVYQYSPLEYQSGGSYSYSSDASLLLPVNAWAGSYVVAARNNWNNWPGFYQVVASQAGTVVTVSPSATGKIIKAGGGISAAGTGTVTLNQGDVLQVLASNGGGSPDISDVTGTIVSASKPVEVFGGHYATNVPWNVTAADHLEEALLPIDALSNQYIVTTPLIAAGTPKDQVVRIIATTAATTLTYDPPAPTWPTTIANVGDFVEIGPTSTSFKVIANHKVLVVGYMPGETYGGGAGDPAMAQAVPVEQYRVNYLFHAPTNYSANFVNVTAPTGAAVSLDGVAIPLAQFSAIGSTGYSIARMPLSNAGNGNHSVTSPSKVGISVYGYGQYTSFWYPGGLDLVKLEM